MSTQNSCSYFICGGRWLAPFPYGEHRNLINYREIYIDGHIMTTSYKQNGIRLPKKQGTN